MKTVILAGGKGTRIRDVPEDIPKPLLNVGDKPILWHIMKFYSQFRFDDFVLCLGFRSKEVKNYILNLNSNSSDISIDLETNKKQFLENKQLEKWKVILAETGLYTQTGCRIFKIKKYVEDDDYFFLTYGDGLSDVNINELLKFHKKHGRHLTVTGVKPAGRFGELKVNGNMVEAFTEKPRFERDYVSGGFFVCSKAVFDYLSDDEKLVFEQDPIKNIVNDCQLMIYKHEGFWQPMDTSVEFQLLNQIWANGDAPWKIW